jgi:hypothetical protein
MNRIASFLGHGPTAEVMSFVACVLGVIGLHRPLIASAGLVAGLVSFVPLVTFGRERYCITGLFIGMLILASLFLFAVSWVRFFAG